MALTADDKATIAGMVKEALPLPPPVAGGNGTGRIVVGVVVFAITAVFGALITLCTTVGGGVILWFATAQFDKTDSTALSMATMTAQMRTQTDAFDELRGEVKTLRAEIATSRIDPFTGSDGDALEQRIDERLRRQEEALRLEIERTSDTVRKLESSVRRNGGE